jgi:quinol monooxygenase YgiN
MIVEYVRYTIPPERRDRFEAAYGAAQAALRASPECLGYELARCADDASSYVLRIEWTSAEGHLSGFRKSPEFGSFFAAVRPFVDAISEMRHYERTPIRSAR